MSAPPDNPLRLRAIEKLPGRQAANMRRAILFGGILGATSIVLPADLVGSDTLLMHLRHDRSSVKWLAESTVVGDLNGDGKTDAAMLGLEANGVVVAVAMHGADGGVHVQYLTFAVGRGSQATICALPARLESQPLSCTEGDGSLPGCRDEPPAVGLSLVDDECDSIHMYWDHDDGVVAWWRR